MVHETLPNEIWFSGESALFKSLLSCWWVFIDKNVYKAKQKKKWLVQKKKHVTWYTENCHNVKQNFQSDKPRKSNGALMSVIAPSKGNWRRAYGTFYKTYMVGEKGRVMSRKRQ